MDVSQLTAVKVEALLLALQTRLDQIRLGELDAQHARTGRIEGSVIALDALLGPVDSVPGVESIRAVRGYDGETMAANAAIALPLAFEGLEILTHVVRDIATSIAASN